MYLNKNQVKKEICLILKLYLLFTDKLKESFGLSGIFTVNHSDPGLMVKYLNPLDS